MIVKIKEVNSHTVLLRTSSKSDLLGIGEEFARCQSCEECSWMFSNEVNVHSRFVPWIMLFPQRRVSMGEPPLGSLDG